MRTAKKQNVQNKHEEMKNLNFLETLWIQHKISLITEHLQEIPSDMRLFAILKVLKELGYKNAANIPDCSKAFISSGLSEPRKHA